MITQIDSPESAQNKRKPHNNWLGYVTERKSRHPKLPGYFAIFDRDNGGDWVTGTDGERWGLLHIKTDNTCGGVCTFSSLPQARSFLYDAVDGGNVVDFGQN